MPKYPWKSEAASEARRRLYEALEEAAMRGDVPSAMAFAAELRRLGADVRLLTEYERGGCDDE